jgi:biopolymer transport protein TolQ
MTPVPSLGLAGTAFDPLRALLHAGPVAQATLVLLVVQSVVAWATWGARRRALGRQERQARAAGRAFRDAADTAAFAAACRRDLPPGPIPRLFAAAHAEYESLFASGARFSSVRAEAGRSLLTRTLAAARGAEVQAARRGLAPLATIGSTAPFIGLFGTVWGVMGAFHDIGLARSADLAVVAPGIAEALVATAAGLFAAVPAVWFHNSLVGRVQRLGGELERFAADFLNAYDRAVAADATPPAAEGTRAP